MKPDQNRYFNCELGVKASICGNIWESKEKTEDGTFPKTKRQAIVDLSTQEPVNETSLPSMDGKKQRNEYVLQ